MSQLRGAKGMLVLMLQPSEAQLVTIMLKQRVSTAPAQLMWRQALLGAWSLGKKIRRSGQNYLPNIKEKVY